MEQCYHKTNKYMTNYTRAERRQIKKQIEAGIKQIKCSDGSVMFFGEGRK